MGDPSEHFKDYHFASFQFFFRVFRLLNGNVASFYSALPTEFYHAFKIFFSREYASNIFPPTPRHSSHRKNAVGTSENCLGKNPSLHFGRISLRSTKKRQTKEQAKQHLHFIAMHGLIVLGFNGAVAFHTSPLTRAVVDSIIEVVQSDLHMNVSSQHYASVVAGLGFGGGGGGSGSSAHYHHSSSSSQQQHQQQSTAAAADQHHLSRSQTSAIYRASVALDRVGGGGVGGGGGYADGSSSAASVLEGGNATSSTSRARGASAFAAKEAETLSSRQRPRRFRFMAKSTEGGSGSSGPLSALSSAATGGAAATASSGASASSGAATNFFISDSAFATSLCMARNVKAVCEGIVALSPSEHAWLRHHIATFVTIGESRREETDDDLIAADPDAVARVGVVQPPPITGSSGPTSGGGAFSSPAQTGGGGGGGGGGGTSAACDGLFASGHQNSNGSGDRLSDIFSKGVTVVPAAPSANAAHNSDGSGGDSCGGNGSPPKGPIPTISGTGGIVLDPSVAAAELFVLLYWRKVGDRVFIMVLREEDSVALAKHALSTFIALLSDAFRLYVPDVASMAEAGVVATGAGGGGSGGSAATHMGMYHGASVSGASGGGASSSAAAAANLSEAGRLFAAVERVMREDAALSQLPSLRAMTMRPDVVQRCLDIVAPHNVLAMVDLPMARVCLQRQMKSK